MKDEQARSDLAHLRKAQAASDSPVDPLLEWRESNLERVAIEARFADAQRQLANARTLLQHAGDQANSFQPTP